MKSYTLASLGVLTMSLLIGGGALATYARQGDNADVQGQTPLNGSHIAVVDMQKVFDDSDAPALMEQKENEIGRQVIQQTNLVAAVSFLNQQELAEYLNIIRAPAPAPAQEARAKELKDLSQKRAQELDALRVKKDLVDADRQRMQQLTDLNQQELSVAPKIDAALQAEGQGKIEDFRREQMRRLRGIVGKVAASRGILDVWDSDSLVYSSNDLTAEVIRKLGKQPGR